jgi:hypothetical protein
MTETPDTLEQAADAIAGSLWERFRLLALAVDRAESFVGMAPGGGPFDEPGKAGRSVEALARNPDEIRVVARELVLRAFRAAIEPANLSLLQALRKEPSTPSSELAAATRLSRLLLHERVNDLIQAGLATKDLETDSVQPTGAVRPLVDLLERVTDAFTRILAERLPDATRR